MTIQRFTEYSINTLTSAVQLFIIMTKCRKCNSGINSTYIRRGEKGFMEKGWLLLFCSNINYNRKTLLSL
jgi:hypothetical protein